MPENAINRGFEEMKAEYIQHLRLKNLSALTLRQVDQALRLFAGWLKGRGIAEVSAVERETFEQYKAYLSDGYLTREGKPLTTSTIRGRLFVVQGWFAWMKKQGALFINPVSDVQIPKEVKRLPRGIMTQGEIRKVMDLPDLKTALGYRDRTMMETLYATGARSNELLTMRVPDIDLEKKVIRIRQGKGGYDRFVPLSTPCCRFLERYLAAVRPELLEGMRPSGNNWIKKAGTGGDILFLSLYGGPMERTWIGFIMRRYLRKAGITRPVSPVHSFRHSVATHLLESGMDIRYVQVFLGHNSINSTQIYTHVERKALKRLLKEFHPREKAGEDVQSFIEEKHASAA